MEATTQINETESGISLPTEKGNPTVTTTVSNLNNRWLNEWNTARAHFHRYEHFRGFW